MWLVLYLPEARQERAALPAAERAALINADAKLGAFGPLPGYPHTSAVRGAESLRELRPRAGRSAWRARRQVGEVFVVAAVGPEAVARLESGDHEPSLATLARLARKLGIEFRIDITPDAFKLGDIA